MSAIDILSNDAADDDEDDDDDGDDYEKRNNNNGNGKTDDIRMNPILNIVVAIGCWKMLIFRHTFRITRTVYYR